MEELKDLMSKATSLPQPQQTRVSAIMGALVADAAGVFSVAFMAGEP